MSVVFFCQNCGSRFKVDPQMAGKRGRCKKCGKEMTVPPIAETTAKAAKPERVAVAAGAAGGSAPATSWLGEVAASKVSLAPLTIDHLPMGARKPSMFAEDDAADAKPYVLAEPERRTGGRVVSPVSGLKVEWRRRLGSVARLFRWINQAAYLVSVPFLMVLLLGIMVRSHPMANLGAIAVVALNIARLLSGFANLVVIPFRDGIDLKKLKKPMRRFIEPAITIAVVGLAFAFSPWLSYRGTTHKGIFPGHIRAGLESFERRLADEQGKAQALEGKPGGNQQAP